MIASARDAAVPLRTQWRNMPILDISTNSDFQEAIVRFAITVGFAVTLTVHSNAAATLARNAGE
jgi:hypothetical protein